MPKKEWLAMLLAGGQGSRLGALTRNIAKPALSFGGKYRIIDFSLSNCVNSNIDTVGVLTQYKPFLLNSYIGIGTAWNMDNKDGGIHVLPPYVGEQGGRWYKGTANAIYENMDFINSYDPEYVLIISGDHIYRMNYEEMLDYHKEKNAEVTIAVIEVPWAEASRFGIMSTNHEDRIVKFAEKPVDPDSNLASMGIYLFNWPVLKKALLEDERRPESANDFGKNIMPTLLEQGSRLIAYRFTGYWQDVGTIDSYFEANMELLKDKSGFDIFSLNNRIFSNSDILAPLCIGPDAEISNCLVGNGCTILGEIRNSVIANGVYVAEGAKIDHAILLPRTRILEGARVCRAITGENAVVEKNAVLGCPGQSGKNENGIAVIEDNCIWSGGEQIWEKLSG